MFTGTGRGTGVPLNSPTICRKITSNFTPVGVILGVKFRRRVVEFLPIRSCSVLSCRRKRNRRGTQPAIGSKKMGAAQAVGSGRPDRARALQSVSPNDALLCRRSGTGLRPRDARARVAPCVQQMRKERLGKAADVMDSVEAEPLFDELFVQGLQNPDAIESECDAVVSQLRSTIAESRKSSELLSDARKWRDHPAQFWLERAITTGLPARGGDAVKEADVWRVRWVDGSESARVRRALPGGLGSRRGRSIEGARPSTAWD